MTPQSAGREVGLSPINWEGVGVIPSPLGGSWGYPQSAGRDVRFFTKWSHVTANYFTTTNGRRNIV